MASAKALSLVALKVSSKAELKVDRMGYYAVVARAALMEYELAGKSDVLQAG